MTDSNYLQIAKDNIALFESDDGLAEYVAFLFSELARLDPTWKENLEGDETK